MSILIGIIAFHMLVIARSNVSGTNRLPIVSIFTLTLLMTAFVLYMLFTMEKP